MGRIVSSIRIENTTDSSKNIRCNGLVSTGVAHLVLPRAWREQLGDLDVIETLELELPTQEVIRGDVCGPVKIYLEGFRPIYNEVVFVEMQPENGLYEPLIGYLLLEQCQAAVDMVGHRLLHVKRMDLK